MARIAFLGTGTMGLPMARNVLRHTGGTELRAWNRSSEKARPLAEDGAEILDAPADAARGAEIIITMLSDADAVLDVASQALSDLPSSAIWLQMSTIGIEGTDLCQGLARDRGVRFVDAPVLGTREPAVERSLVVLASGEDDALERCRPVFDALGRTMRIGPAGTGTRCKVAVNSWVLGVTGLIAETLSLARALEIDPQNFFAAVEGGTLDLPYARLKGGMMVDESFDDAAFRLALARKDADLVLAAADQASLDTPVLRAIADRFRRAEEAGHGDEDMAANYLATRPAP